MNLFDKLGELMQKTPEELSAMAKKQNEKLGLNGSFAFCISLKMPNGKYQEFLRIPDLKEMNARYLHLIFDTSNRIRFGNYHICVRNENDDIVDYNLLPNIHTVQVQK